VSWHASISSRRIQLFDLTNQSNLENRVTRSPRIDRAKVLARRGHAAKCLGILIFAACSLIALASTGAADEAAKTGDLKVMITNLDSDKGYLIVGLINSVEQFSTDVLPFRSVETVPIVDGRAQTLFEDIRYGTYAVKTFHDENSNGKLDTNFVGFPKEGFGFSNDAMGRFGPPTFEQATFRFESEKLRIEIKSN
jgi:uncharacterized protein (DUF2141 family)